MEAIKELTNISGYIVNYMIILMICLVVFNDLPLTNYLIDPMINIIKNNPSVISLLMLFSVTLFTINQIIQSIINFKKIKK